MNGTNGATSFAVVTQAFVQRPIGIELFDGPLVGRPKPVAAAADVPIRERVDELGDVLAGAEVVVRVHPLDDRRARAIQLAQDPAIQLAALGTGRYDFAVANDAGIKLPDPRPLTSDLFSAGSNPSMFA